MQVDGDSGKMSSISFALISSSKLGPNYWELHGKFRELSENGEINKELGGNFKKQEVHYCNELR